MTPSTRFARSGQGTVAAAVLILPVIALAIGCSRPPEQQFLTQFFRAAKSRDNTTVGRMSAVQIDPRTQGSVESFSIDNISAETRTPLSFKPLFEAETMAKQDERTFLDTKIAYQNANIKAVEEVLKIEQTNPNPKYTPAQQKTMDEWNKWRAGISEHARTTAAATAAIKRGTGVAEASLTQPGQPALDPKTFEGETIKKDVTVKAKVKSPEGVESDKTLVITIERGLTGLRQ